MKKGNVCLEHSQLSRNALRQYYYCLLNQKAKGGEHVCLSVRCRGRCEGTSRQRGPSVEGKNECGKQERARRCSWSSVSCPGQSQPAPRAAESLLLREALSHPPPRGPPRTRFLNTYIFPAQSGFAVFTVNVCDCMQSR